MLALARKVNESIMLGNDIEITLLEIKGDQVKIGISAPKSVPIYRKEIYLQIQEENKQAAGQEIDVQALKSVFGEKSIKQDRKK
ncbi:MAG: carbon storage regulator CsrA [Lachnospiraceae bacterium]|nr:carbon storage regulator CsrA [Lachnospiraceae bacterium]